MARPKKKVYEQSENSCVVYVAIEYEGKRVSHEFEVTGLIGKLLKRDRNIDYMLSRAVGTVKVD